MHEIPIRSFAVSVFVLRRDGQHDNVLLMRRTGNILTGEWCQVAGEVERGETAWQAALRETSEETGLALDRLYSADMCEQFYEADRDAITLTPVFVGYVAQGSTVQLNAEHSEFRWVSLDDAVQLVPFTGQRTTLEHIRREFVERAPNPLLLIYQKP